MMVEQLVKLEPFCNYEREETQAFVWILLCPGANSYRGWALGDGIVGITPWGGRVVPDVRMPGREAEAIPLMRLRV